MRLTDTNGVSREWTQQDEQFFAAPHREPCTEKLAELLRMGKAQKGAVIKLHLEDFKSFNNIFGYQFGGMFLQEIAQFLCGLDGADVYRIAGVEFVMILENKTRQAVEGILGTMMGRFEHSWHLGGMDCMCAVNMGLCWLPAQSGTEDADALLEDLTQAVGESATIGPNQAAIFDGELMHKIVRKNAIARKLPELIQSGAVEVRYRPTWSTVQKRFTRADCYIRLLNEEFGMVPAQEFLAIAEQSGQIGAVSQYVIQKTCTIIGQLIREGRDFETIAVPISPIQFMQERFAQEVQGILDETGIPAERLAFEITEMTTMSAFPSAQANLGDLAEMGIEIVLTEFGTGYSGLNSVLNMPVDVVKLERLLIWQLDNDPRASHLVEGLIHIANNLGIKLIAEGVETETQVEFLQASGCEYEQGFYYSPTLMPEELKDAFRMVK
jgi:FOG: EAL domain